MATSNTPTPHIEAREGEIARTHSAAGDPLRAKYIADNFMEDVKQFNGTRNMLGYTGTYQGRPVSVMGTGMGLSVHRNLFLRADPFLRLQKPDPRGYGGGAYGIRSRAGPGICHGSLHHQQFCAPDGAARGLRAGLAALSYWRRPWPRHGRRA